ncbi:MAG: hypothetical protein WCH86_02275 [Kiritimatiellales bacterium]
MSFFFPVFWFKKVTSASERGEQVAITFEGLACTSEAVCPALAFVAGAVAARSGCPEIVFSFGNFPYDLAGRFADLRRGDFGRHGIVNVYNKTARPHFLNLRRRKADMKFSCHKLPIGSTALPL